METKFIIRKKKMFNFKNKKKLKQQQKEIELHDKPYLDRPINLERKHFRYKILFINGETEEGEIIKINVICQAQRT